LNGGHEGLAVRFGFAVVAEAANEIDCPIGHG
jgi:hypothetical protein